MRLRTLVLLLLPIAAASARASDRDEAKKKVHEAQIAYNLGKFDDALAGFEEAYRLEPVPDLLFNIAQCHRQMREFEKADFFYRRYLALKAAAPNKAQVEQLLHDVDAEIEKKKTEAAAEAQKAAADAEAKKEAEQAAQQAATQVPAPPPTVAVPLESGSSAIRWVGVAVGVVGLAGIGTGAFLGVQAQNDAKQVTQLIATHQRWNGTYQALDQAGYSDGLAAPILMGVGGAAVVGGVLMAIFGASPSTDSAVVAPAPGGGAVQWTHRF